MRPGSTADRQKVLVSGPHKVRIRDRSGVGSTPFHKPVYVRRDGAMAELGRGLSLWQALAFRARYDVDTGRHAGVWEWVFPSATTEADFRVEARVGWKVTSPSEVVRRGLLSVDEAERIVADEVVRLLRPAVQAYRVDQGKEALEHVRSVYADGMGALAVGITVLDLSVWIVAPEGSVQGERAAPAQPGRRPGNDTGGPQVSPGLARALRRAEPDVRTLHDYVADRSPGDGQVQGTDDYPQVAPLPPRPSPNDRPRRGITPSDRGL